MVFYLCLGMSGEGKTLLGAYFSACAYLGEPSVALATNTPFKFTDQYEDIRTWEQMNGLRDKWVLLDEVNNLLDGREAGNALNKEQTIHFNQYRKQNLMVFCTAQQWGRVDMSLREQLSLLYIPIYHDLEEEIFKAVCFKAHSMEVWTPAPHLDITLRTTHIYDLYDSFTHVNDLNKPFQKPEPIAQEQRPRKILEHIDPHLIGPEDEIHPCHPAYNYIEPEVIA